MKKTSFLVIAVALLVAVTLVVQRTRRISAAPRLAASGAAASAEAKEDAPNFTVKDLNGASVSMTDYKGKVVLINFWATWCEPCRVDIPWLIGFQNKYAARGFTVLGMAMDDGGVKDVDPFVRDERFDVDGQKLPMNYPILIGNDDVGDKFGGLLGLPTSVLISRDGKKIKTFIGLVDHEKFVKAIEEQLQTSN
ncbi:MAG TPA: TlpA disulfide reductase family protein [Candidatus Acidoferrum sp.]|nr:TlpA disulfide reductase family protein [Candidatus Acidoferrum sp.]